MTLTQLSYIVAVDKYRHFATAARKTFITQPTLSMQIHKLEEELGQKIFDRSRTPVVPTPIGEKIISQAKKMLAEAKAIEDLARAQDHSLKGTFKIGIVSTVAPYLLPRFLHPFIQRYPETKLILEEGLTRDLVEAVADDRLDAALIASPPDQPNIFEQELYFEPFVSYVPEGHVHARLDRIDIDQINPEELLLLDEGHCFRDQAEKLCSRIRNSVPNRIQFSSGNLETLRRLVEQGCGVTLLPYLAVEEELEHPGQGKGRVVPFKEPQPSRRVRLVYSREYLSSTLIRALKKRILEQLPEELKEGGSRKIIE